MTEDTKRRTANALHNAAEFIRSHVEQGGIDPEDVDETTENGLLEYNKACHRAARLIESVARRYEK